MTSPQGRIRFERPKANLKERSPREKIAKGDLYRQASNPRLFEDQALTPSGGLVVFQGLFETCQLEGMHQTNLTVYPQIFWRNPHGVVEQRSHDVYGGGFKER
jgi:hypothetical protein